MLSVLLSVMIAAGGEEPLFNDSHLHLTNYVQQGPTADQLLKTMGTKVGRATLFGIPLQQQWSHRVSGDDAPTYYLQTDAPLYYYSFTDAYIAQAYLALSAAQRARLEPMITGVNPTDMYAADHLRRVLETFPGVFTGVGEFTIHKEFVSSKIAGEVASLTDPALDRILDFAGETGLVVLLHNDIDQPFAKDDSPPVHLEQLTALFKRHPSTSIIWAHAGVGRVVHPVNRHLAMIEKMLNDPKLSHVNIDLSWAETAKYIVASPEAIKRTAAIINRFPDRFLFGTDEVGPKNEAEHLRVYKQYAPLLAALNADAREKFLKGNFARIFDEGRKKVRAWEKANVTRASSR